MSRYATLLLLLKHMGYVNGRVQFQKLVFLLEKNYHINSGYDFIPFKFGPYCQTIQEDIQHLIDYGYVEHEEVEKPGGEFSKITCEKKGRRLLHHSPSTGTRIRESF